MKTVGLRELKNKLSEYVREIRSGETVLVTDRGEVVAELTPPGALGADRGAPAGLVALARKGHATLAACHEAPSYPALAPLFETDRGAQLLDEERGGR